MQRRLARHRAGGASRYTASRLPVELALALPMADRARGDARGGAHQGARPGEQARADRGARGLAGERAVRSGEAPDRPSVCGMMGVWLDDPPARSVKISEDERTGWSSDRPRRDGAPAAPGQPRRPLPRARARPTGCATRPGSLLDRGLRLARPSATRFLERLIEDRAALLSLEQGARRCSPGASAEEELEARAAGAAAGGRRQAPGEPGDGRARRRRPATRSEREPFVRLAAALKRPRHLILLETSPRPGRARRISRALNELRRALDARRAGRRGLSDGAAPRRRLGRSRSSGSCSARRRARTTSARHRRAGRFEHAAARAG